MCLRTEVGGDVPKKPVMHGAAGTKNLWNSAFEPTFIRAFMIV
jgi:hypothetical protein